MRSSRHHSRYLVAHVCLLDRTLDLYSAPSGVPRPGLEVLQVSLRAHQSTHYSILSSSKFSCRFARTNQSLSWLSFIINQLSRSGFQFQQDQPPLPPPPAQPAPSSTSPPVLPPPTAASAASQAPSNRLPQPQLQEDAVTKLLEENHDVFDKLINHPFPQTLGDGSASLDGFRYYMIVSHL